ncbi:hypothetical protein C2S51_004900 [Perilla frutescens var. frutescens]|nr:hypothetical protein C2S51_004900 [Perilla frutescens var. frutescens]
MAAHSNKSPSPLSSRPINPNSRNSENNSSIRRSFSGGNPFSRPSVLTNQGRFDPTTPANSPSDFARRRSVGKEGTASHLRDSEEKENDEKDNVLKASKMQTPTKGCKNFMAPTISAASKFTPSPRKKVLVERNDAVRTSISLSDGKAMFFSAMANAAENLEAKTETSLNSSNLADSQSKKAVIDSHPASRPRKKVTFSSSDTHIDSQHSNESVITDSDSLRPESSSMNKVVSSSITPLDADPSLPPYDPKTNYLSPRPQFIRYKPNPRVEMLLNKENGMDSDELMAEIMSSFSESSADEGTDESQTEDSKKEEKEMEIAAAAAADMVIGVDEEIEADSHVSELSSQSLPVSTTPANAISEEEFVHINEKKPRTLSRLVCSSMILMFLIAGVSIYVMRSPSFDESFIKDLSLSDLSNLYQQSRVFVASARSSAGRLARHVNDASANSVSFIFKLANGLGKGKKQAPMQFMNLSDLQEKNPWNNEGNFPTIVASLERAEEDEFEEELDDEMDYAFEEEEYVDEEVDEDVLDTEMDTFEEETYAYAYAEADSDDYIVKGHDTREDVVATAELESEELLIQPELISNELNSEDHQSAASQHQETEVEAAMGRLETEKSEAAADSISTDQTSFNKLMQEMESTSAEESSLALHAVAIPYIFAGLLAVAAFIYHYMKKTPSSSSNVVQVEPMLNKRTDYGHTSTMHHIHQEKEFSQNWQQTEVDAITGGVESDMSSSFLQRSGSYRMSMRDEVQSSERKTRKNSKRESLASSSEFSMGSPSYGSFTTYERIPIKSNANVDEEIMTPVRRSSRIRSHHHVTST